jgi:hypothetical protein
MPVPLCHSFVSEVALLIDLSDPDFVLCCCSVTKLDRQVKSLFSLPEVTNLNVAGVGTDVSLGELGVN